MGSIPHHVWSTGLHKPNDLVAYKEQLLRDEGHAGLAGLVPVLTTTIWVAFGKERQ